MFALLTAWFTHNKSSQDYHQWTLLARWTRMLTPPSRLELCTRARDHSSGKPTQPSSFRVWVTSARFSSWCIRESLIELMDADSKAQQNCSMPHSMNVKPAKHQEYSVSTNHISARKKERWQLTNSLDYIYSLALSWLIAANNVETYLTSN